MNKFLKFDMFQNCSTWGNYWLKEEFLSLKSFIAGPYIKY